MNTTTILKKVPGPLFCIPTAVFKLICFFFSPEVHLRHFYHVLLIITTYISIWNLCRASLGNKDVIATCCALKLQTPTAWWNERRHRSDPLFRQMSRTEKLIWVKGFLFVVQQSLIASTLRQIHYQHKKVTSHSVHQIANDCGQNIQILFTDSILQNAKAKKKYNYWLSCFAKREGRPATRKLLKC